MLLVNAWITVVGTVIQVYSPPDNLLAETRRSDPIWLAQHLATAMSQARFLPVVNTRLSGTLLYHYALVGWFVESRRRRTVDEGDPDVNEVDRSQPEMQDRVILSTRAVAATRLA